MSEGEISIEGLDKAAVLAALFNGSRQQGMGFMNAGGQQPMTIEKAQAVIDRCNGDLYFDYLGGRVLKVDIGGNMLQTHLYNRDIGDGAAERIIDKLRGTAKSAAA